MTTRPFDSTWRLWLLRLGTVLVFGLLLSRLALMQFVRGPGYQQQAVANRVRIILSEGERGVIYDRDGRILARNTVRFGVAVVPANLPDDPDYTTSQARRHAVYAEVIRLINEALSEHQRTVTPTPTPSPRVFPPALFPGISQPPTPTILDLETIDRLVAEREAGSAFAPVLIAENLPREVALRVAEETYRLPGVELGLRPMRYYPAGADTAHVIGYMGPIPEETRTTYIEKGYSADAWVGWTGLEFTFEDVLRGRPGRRVIEVDVNGRERGVLGPETAPQPGQNLILSLDLELQQAMREALVVGINPKRSESAVAIALDPRTGFVLGLVSLPSYDNNIFADGITAEEYKAVAEARGTPLLNHAIGGIYPPGSTFKPVVAAAGLEERVITPATLLDDPGIIYLPNRNAPDNPLLAQPFVCWIHKYGGAHGALNVKQALGVSCDVFFYKLGGGWYATNFEGLGVDTLAAYAQYFGFGELTGIDLPGEHRGLVPNPRWKRIAKGERWVTGDTYNMAIGQGDILATPLQVALMTMAVANDGYLYRPQLVAAITDAASQLVRRMEPDLIRRVPVSPQHMAVVREGLWMAVNTPAGTARYAALPGITVAGKTGTAEFFDPDIPRDGKGNLPTHAWFTAFAPYEDPEIVVTVFVYNGGEGSEVAVPIARRILETYFELKARDETTGTHSVLDGLLTPETETPVP